MGERSVELGTVELESAGEGGCSFEELPFHFFSAQFIRFQLLGHYLLPPLQLLLPLGSGRPARSCSCLLGVGRRRGPVAAAAGGRVISLEVRPRGGCCERGEEKKEREREEEKLFDGARFDGCLPTTSKRTVRF